jgi:hypothetical protein
MRIPESREQRIGCLLSLAIVISPFLALLYGVPAALAVLAIATATTAWLTFSASQDAAPQRRSSLLAAAVLNAVFAVIALWMFINRVF